ncbi:putative Glycoprotein-N-acetylgalactosamine 3-beta-galactosyltransferase 1 [Daphnia magna]|uniref:Putative Glycoprotein-N-acetylgalactosamine 3-beta-galactosyltransferase 1 n=1 Tax=Daphnia magna TaxID=35525 RepID=A0A164JVW3_9CRUS|nr:putative Glycoprotein-N-acetylgalactosamine 3-beta-galactosyltransferase 1 [Daphnia magna]
MLKNFILSNSEAVSLHVAKRHKPRFPGDDVEDAHGHDHGDAHNEEDMESLAGPVRDFGLHGRHEDSNAG